MPVSISLLIVSGYVRYITPNDWIIAVDTIYPRLSIIFSLAFIATAMKSVNDILWLSVLDTYIQKTFPRTELGKMLGLSGVLVMKFLAFGPLLAGIIYTNWQGLPLLAITLIFNIVILVILGTKSLEPRVSVDELETEGSL
ncbi:MAG: hypothetical protein P1Q69_05635 [Candidatus Thorarchaeota archaeon]|nr:hypothetical protein [Candidatus Thorarchaeota archaeon]